MLEDVKIIVPKWVLRAWTKAMFTTSIWPSIWGWNAVENLSWHPSSTHIVFQNVLRKKEYLSDMIVLGRTKCGQTCHKYNSVVYAAIVVFVHGVKSAILLKRHTTTQIASCFFWVVGSPLRNSMEIDSQGREGRSNGWYKPCFWLDGLDWEHNAQYQIYCVMRKRQDLQKITRYNHRSQWS